MTRKITKQQRAMRKFNYQLKQMTATIAKSGVSAREAMESMTRFVLAWQGKTPAWPQFHHIKETPERSKMHAMYGRRRNG